MKRLYRARSGRMLEGVCAGIANYFALDPTLVRLLWVVFTAMGGAGSNIDITIDGHVALLRDLAQAVREDREPILPPEDALAAIKVICGIYESSRTGRPVRI